MVNALYGATAYCAADAAAQDHQARTEQQDRSRHKHGRDVERDAEEAHFIRRVVRRFTCHEGPLFTHALKLCRRAVHG